MRTSIFIASVLALFNVCDARQEGQLIVDFVPVRLPAETTTSLKQTTKITKKSHCNPRKLFGVTVSDDPKKDYAFVQDCLGDWE